MSYRWEFEFGTVDLTGDKIVVEAEDSYKNVFQKKYKETTEAKLGKEAEKVLKNVWDKGKRKSEGVNFLIKSELQDFFDAIAASEGITKRAITASVSEAEAYRDRDTRDDLANLFDVMIDEQIQLRMKAGEISESSVSGFLRVMNNGRKNRIWDIDLELTGGDNTDIKNKKFHILDLDPQEDWTQDYKINVKEITSPLNIEQIVNTSPEKEGEASHTFILNQEHETLFQIVLKNDSEATVTNVELIKGIASEFDKVSINNDSGGKVDKDSDKLTWRIEEIPAGASKTLEFTAKITPRDKEPINSGPIELKYLIPEDTYSGLAVDYVDGYSDNIYYVDRDERDEQPDVWDCRFIFKNRSEFPLKLLDVDLRSGDYNTEEKVVDLGPQLDPDVIVNPGEEWESQPWEVESEDLPTFGKDVQFTIVGDVINQLSALVTVEAIELPVLTLSGTKEFSQLEIPSFRKTELEATITVNTSGKAPIDKFHIEDTIPPQFEAPNSITMTVGEKDISAGNIEISYEPTASDIEDERKMIVAVTEVLDTIGVLEDETEIKIIYPLIAIKPARDTEYFAPVVFNAITQDGSTIGTEIEPEPIKVIHERRRYSDGRIIQQGSSKGQYTIIIIHKNKSDASEIDRVFEEVLPENFSLISAKPEPKKTGDKLTWTFEEIKPDEEIEIEFNIEGSGDYKAREAQKSFSS
ncbi:MAG: hypothetical protein EAX96_18720 [Candidatus Lokiarchaeota archaeon]|nr:hypothetical protein [Candidatus Lokiarchaeota archaeon]